VFPSLLRVEANDREAQFGPWCLPDKVRVQWITVGGDGKGRQYKALSPSSPSGCSALDRGIDVYWELKAKR